MGIDDFMEAACGEDNDVESRGYHDHGDHSGSWDR